MKLSYNKLMTAYLLLVTVLVLALCFWTSFYVRGVSAELRQGLAGMDTLVAGGSWDEAGRQLAADYAVWQEKRGVWLGLMNHQDVVNIDLAFISLQAYLEQQKPEDTLNQLAAVRYYLELMSENERLTWHNFF